MRTVVCVKQVPDTTEVKVDPQTGTLIRAGVPSILNPYDHFAVEWALKLKARHGGEVTVLTMGPPQAKAVLQLALALGCDRAMLLSDRAFAGSDTWATSYALARAVKKIGKFDLILCGQQAIDGDTAQVGPGVAQSLHIPQITFCDSIEVEGRKAKVQRHIDDGYEIVEAKLPVLCTMSLPHAHPLPWPSFPKVAQARSKVLEVWTAADIGAEPEKIGLKGSPTQVHKVYPPPLRAKGTVFTGSASEMASKLLDILRQENFIKP
ncbi:MAG TPA: electron transfer flavoprotein subunit beta [Elusimicrobia bacterium]|nr:electron transfer flavoprotein subunit beta [Elusimicrobiota bacterium]